MVPTDRISGPEKAGKRKIFYWVLPVAYAIITLGHHGRRTLLQENYTIFNDSRENSGRHLLAEDESCTPPGINDYPSDFMTQSERQQGGVVFHILLSCYMCYALAIVCDDYFIPSLEGISQALDLPSDVAGATFMAAGTSAPELFMSMIGVFITEGDIGIGTIIGSAVFNILAVVSVCGLLAGKLVPLDWWPLSRDCLAYTFTVIALIFILEDEKVYWYEATILVIMFFLYITIMYFNQKLEKLAHLMISKCNCTKNDENEPLIHDHCRVRRYSTISCESEHSHHSHEHRKHLDSEGRDDIHAHNERRTRTYSTASAGSDRSRYSHHSHHGTEEDREQQRVSSHLEQVVVTKDPLHLHQSKENDLNEDSKQAAENFFHDEQIPEMEEINITENETKEGKKETNLTTSEEDDEEEMTISRMPRKNSCKQIMWVLMWPVLVLFYITIPDCRKERWQRWFPVTFLIAITYIGFLSYLLSWMVTVVGYTFNIPDTVMGLTFLAAGTSVPEAISSVIVCQQGFGNMAISNSVGSNVFDILFCLGLPWLVKSIMNSQNGNYVLINSKGIEYSAIILLSTVLVMFGSIALNKFKLDKRVGVACLLMYLIFLVISSLFELNIFGQINLPTCSID